MALIVVVAVGMGSQAGDSAPSGSDPRVIPRQPDQTNCVPFAWYSRSSAVVEIAADSEGGIGPTVAVRLALPMVAKANTMQGLDSGSGSAAVTANILVVPALAALK